METKEYSYKKPPYNVFICGVGGQGIIKTSIIIGEAAMDNGLDVVMSEIHGMAQRGGSVSTEIKIGSSKSSIIQEGTANVLLAFEPLEAVRALSKTHEETSIIINTSPIMPFNILGSEHPYPEIKTISDELNKHSNHIYALDAENMAKEAGHILSLNMVLLGGATAIPGFILNKETIIDAMGNNLPPKSMKINLKAFLKGYDAVKSQINQK
ncbi:indolepyruvate oxidoreductase subunit beta [Methanobacterium alcaliphilum]|uniref:indolepyruvate oxidoreductase subunit beta n=1 Tax=Methanobacterium alcaliphilum TaxID=392018 RepID=UPI00200B6864|nr:indolepyruvate oxidoreductase subunit beta [Methanobacterium alcaliphilum]MCK9151241.1 indolepyruvate oxidoreductase subunit beta [Methanobacterium alcaliphilum]